MIPQIFYLGPIPINSFGLMVALAFLAGIYRLAISFEKVQINPDLAETVVLTGGFSGLVGARLWYLIRHYSEIKDNFFGAAFSGAGFVFYGGFLTSVLFVFFVMRRYKLPVAAFIDSLGPTLALTYAIGRVGCQLSGDGDYGMATTSIFGMSYESGVVPTAHGVLAYPTPLYESFMTLFILWLLTKAENSEKWSVPYSKFGLYLLLMSIERFLVEFLRIEERIFWGFSEAQLVALCLGVIGSVLLLRSGKKLTSSR
jgi:phosphatidylglycerol:prolipoprotein diacylglycerol transferase